jgi:hypothetical protein
VSASGFRPRPDDFNLNSSTTTISESVCQPTRLTNHVRTASPKDVVRLRARRQLRPFRLPSLARRLRRVDVERTATHRARPRQWRDILASALAEHEAISVRGAVISHLRRTPTQAEITAARRAAHRLAANGQASILHIRPRDLEGVRGRAYLILARPGTAPESGLLDELADTTHFEEDNRIRFEPAVMAQELATSVELLAAAIQAIPRDRLGESDAKRLVIEIERPLEILRQIRRHLRREM